jgi:hypothetical protein
MEKKYKIEGNIDFFSELYKSLDEDDKNEDENEDKKCLITNQLLTDRFVKLNCGHLFNYLPLLNDIKNHKEKFNNLEGSHTKLKQDEIRCPYCRKRQSEVLPYYEDLYPNKINGVNCIMPFLLFPNYLNYKPPNSIEGNCCFQMENMNICLIKHVYNFEDGKTYCYSHRRIMTIKLLKDAELKKKEAAKQAKMKEKEAVKQEKIKEKEAAKEAKLKEKEDAKQAKMKEKVVKKKNFIKMVSEIVEQNEIVSEVVEQNEVVSEIVEQNEIVSEIVIDLTKDTGCIEILKYGANKGNQCGKNIFNNNLCKRHFDK